MQTRRLVGIGLLALLVSLGSSGCIFTMTSGGKTVTFGGSGGKEVARLVAESDRLRLAGKFDEAEKVGRNAIALARKGGNHVEIGFAGQVLGMVLAVMGRHEEAAEIAAEVRKAGAEPIALNIEAAIDLYRCEFDAAAGKYLEMTRISKGSYGAAEGNLALVDTWEGRFERANERFAHAAAIFAKQKKDPVAAMNERYMVLNTAAADARAGRPAKARAILSARADLPDLSENALTAAAWSTRERKAFFMAYQELVAALLVEKALGNDDTVKRLSQKIREVLDLYERSDSACRRVIPNLLAIELPSTRALILPPPPPAAEAPPAAAASNVPPPPPRDSDGDGIPDALDECVDEPETINGVDDGDGCPDETVGYLAGREIHLKEQIPFAFDSDRIEDEGKPILDWLASFLAGHPEISAISIEGHTDDQGEDGYNLALSRKRAEAVVAALLQRNVASSRLSATGFGESRPRFLGTDEESRAANRRVEILATITETVFVPVRPRTTRPSPLPAVSKPVRLEEAGTSQWSSDESFDGELADLPQEGGEDTVLTGYVADLDRDGINEAIVTENNSETGCFGIVFYKRDPKNESWLSMEVDSGFPEGRWKELSMDCLAPQDGYCAICGVSEGEAGGKDACGCFVWDGEKFRWQDAASNEAGVLLARPTAIASPGAGPSPEASATPASFAGDAKKLTKAPADIPCDGECIALLVRLDEDDLEDAIVSDYSEFASGSNEVLQFFRRLPGKGGWEAMDMRTEAVNENGAGHFWNRVTVYPSTEGKRPVVCVPGEVSGRFVIHDDDKEACYYWQGGAWTARDKSK